MPITTKNKLSGIFTELGMKTWIELLAITHIKIADINPIMGGGIFRLILSASEIISSVLFFCIQS
jgi:hypothetical protein